MNPPPIDSIADETTPDEHDLLAAVRALPWPEPGDALDTRVAALLAGETSAGDEARVQADVGSPVVARVWPKRRVGLALAASILLAVTAGLAAWFALGSGPRDAPTSLAPPPNAAVATAPDPAPTRGAVSIVPTAAAPPPVLETITYHATPGPVLRTDTGLPVRPVRTVAISTTHRTDPDTGQTLQVITPYESLVFVQQPVY